MPKPEAIVFSGGQEEHYSLAKTLSDILDEQGIKSVSGYQSASHCGIARLSYPTCLVKCEFDLWYESGACLGLLVVAAKDTITMTKQDIYKHESEFIDHIAWYWYVCYTGSHIIIT